MSEAHANEAVRARMHAGRVSVPSEVRRQAGWSAEEELEFELLENGEVRLRSRTQRVMEAVHDVQALVRRYASADTSVVDELIAERRVEAAREAEK